MLHLALLCSSLLAAAPGEPVAVSPETFQAYEAAKARAGRDPDAHVKLALWCEEQGLGAERLKHLALAVLTDPKNATARGLMGLVAYKGQWQTPDKVSAELKSDDKLAAKLAEYNARREALDERLGSAGYRGRRIGRVEAARAHVSLGLWCEENGLKAEAVAHYTSAVVLDPYHDATWKHLGYVKHNGRWMSREQVAAEQAETEARRKAAQQWEPLLRKWRVMLGDPKKRTEAEQALAGVTDPRAVPIVTRVFAVGTESDQLVAVQLLGQIASPASTQVLAELAVVSPSASVRKNATEALKGREPRDYAGALVDQIHAPMTYRVEPVRGPGSPGALLVESPRFKVLRTYDAPLPFQLGENYYGYIGFDANGLPVAARGRELDKMATEKPAAAAVDLAAIEARTVQMLADASLKALSSQQRLIADVYALETTNAQAGAVNGRVVLALKAAASAPADLTDGDEDGWHKWWYDQVGYRYDPPQQVQVVQNASPQLPAPSIVSCFAAGTPVRTLDGLKPIESLRVGDQVLSQDAATGALGFEAVLVVHHNPPGETLDVALDDGDTLRASVYHRFWRAGRGWAMARELKAGDVVRTLGGRAKVVSVSPGPVVPVFNLDVANSRTFFVGGHDALVHDNTPPDPHLKPFDAAPGLAAAPSSRR